jgi:hypothetical protein
LNDPEITAPYGYCQCGCGNKTRLAPQSDTKLGWVKGEPIKRIHGHQGGVKQPKRYRPVDRGFNTECWEWQGGSTPQGYGRTKGDHGKLVPAHRYFYELHIGPIPEGLVIDHLCKNPPCVNPDHLETVTVTENNRRGDRTKLTVEQVAEIRERAKTAPRPRSHPRGDWNRKIMAEYGICREQLGNIVSGRQWAA